MRRGGDRRRGVEGIEQAALGGRVGHELRDALRALRAHGVAAEAALLPDQAGEEADRDLVVLGGGFDQRAKRLFGRSLDPPCSGAWRVASDGGSQLRPAALPAAAAAPDGAGEQGRAAEQQGCRAKSSICEAGEGASGILQSPRCRRDRLMRLLTLSQGPGSRTAPRSRSGARRGTARRGGRSRRRAPTSPARRAAGPRSA